MEVSPHLPDALTFSSTKSKLSTGGGVSRLQNLSENTQAQHFSRMTEILFLEKITS